MTSLLAQDANLRLDSVSDALDILSSGLASCIFTVEDLHPEFFDLKNGLAGECFQKFVNYNFNIAIVLPDPQPYGDRIVELKTDHERHPNIRFFDDVAAAEAWLTAKPAR